MSLLLFFKKKEKKGVRKERGTIRKGYSVTLLAFLSKYADAWCGC
jgi:hypothetical protein